MEGYGTLAGMAAGMQAELYHRAAGVATRRQAIARLTRAAQFLANQTVLARLRVEQQELAGEEAALIELERLLSAPLPTVAPRPVVAPLPPPAAPPVAAAAPRAAPAPLALPPGAAARPLEGDEAPQPGQPREYQGASWLAASERVAVRAPAPSVAPTAPVAKRVEPLLAVTAADPDEAAAVERIAAIAATMPRPRREPEAGRSLVELEEYLEEVDRWLLQQCRGGELGELEFRERLALFRQAARERLELPGDHLLWREELKLFVAKRGQYFDGTWMDELNWGHELSSANWGLRAAGYMNTRKGAAAILWIEGILAREKDPAVWRELPPLLESATALIVPFARWLEAGVGELSDGGVRLWVRRAQEAAETLEVRLAALKSHISLEALGALGERLPERWEAARHAAGRKARIEQAYLHLEQLAVRPGFGSERGDREQFGDAVAALTAEGVPPSAPRLRVVVMQFTDLTEGDMRPDVAAAHREAEAQLLREEAAPKERLTTPRAVEALSKATRAKLEELRPYTRGKLLLMLGGRPDSRARVLGELFECDFQWPNMEQSSDDSKVERQVMRPGVFAVLANRFNSCHVGQYRRMCQKAGVVLLIVNRIGISQVIDAVWEQREQLVRASGAAREPLAA